MRLLPLVSLALAAPLFTSCLGSGSSINVYGGQRTLDTDDFGSLDEQTAYGADVVLKTDWLWTSVEGGMFRAEEEDDTAGLTDAELVTDDYFLGLRITPWTFLIAPYASAGVTYLDASLDSTTVSEDDETFAYYARLGAAMTFAMFRIGLDGRALFGTDVDFDTLESDVDSYQLTLFLGLGF